MFNEGSLVMKKRIISAATIGAGSIAQHCHMPGYARSPHAELTAFADPDPARHREIKKLFPAARGYKTHEEMFANEKLDVVSICTPNKFHAEGVFAALDAGCHVLCEKPMATTLDDARKMDAAAKKARKLLMIGFTHRTFAGNKQCKEILTKRGLGKPFMIRLRFAHGGPFPGWAKNDWFYNKDLAAGGALLDMGIHAIDLALWLMGPISAVTAKTAAIVKRIEVDDNALMLLEFASGALGYIEVGWTSKPGFTGFEVYGTKGSLICDYNKGLQLCGGKASAGEDSVSEWKVLDKNPAVGGWPAEMVEWLEILRGKRRLTMTGQDGINALAVALAAYKSSKTGRRVEVG